ncbi:hypothetical protein COLO4_20534 [Corchorus olitorius]|uniref:Uncharacterized protein n=1 Tax=Corchorus olitorius TaxID=93759 RepID=A0A1R3IZ98_9ROSI|nr:hypothetical protein COLO4_20534 [Corchorus olitorius]
MRRLRRIDSEYALGGLCYRSGNWQFNPCHVKIVSLSSHALFFLAGPMR